MNIFKKTIPFAIVAIPLLGMASASMPAHPAYPEMTAQADSDSVSMGTVIDEVIWVVGDEAILKSDVEQMRMQAVRFRSRSPSRNCSSIRPSSIVSR